MKKLTKVIALILVFASIACLFSVEAFAASSVKGKTRTFAIRTSKDYSKVGTVTIKATNSDGTKGTITFNSDVSGNKPGAYVSTTYVYGFDRGQVYEYSISKMKDGGKITLKLKSGNYYYGIYSNSSYTGKIHISGSKTWNNITKIDCLNAGIYFQDR